MPVDPPEESGARRFSPETLARKTFGTSFRGFDQIEVRAYLTAVADELRDMRDHEADLRSRLQAAEERAGRGEEIDEHRLTQILGEETARVLGAAREASAEIRAKAEESVARMLREAQDEATATRADAEAHAEHARQVAEEIKERAKAEGAAEVEATRRQGREMVTEAQAVRERVLSDLSRRRKQARAQIEQVRAGRERLLAAYDVVRKTLDEATNELRVALPEAKEAAEHAGLHAIDEPDEAVADVAPEAEPEVVEVDVVEVTIVGAEPWADPEPLVPVEPSAPFEGVRLISVDTGSEQVEPDDADFRPPVLELVGESETDLQLVADPEPDIEVVEPEVEPEPEARQEPETEPVAEASEVDALFARIRASRAADVANAKEVLAEPRAPAMLAPAAQPADALDAEAGSAVQTLLERRDAATDDVEHRLARRLKRVLSDEQNEVLDRLRRSKVASIDDLLVPLAEQAARYARGAASDLGTAAASGAAFYEDREAAVTVVDDLADELALVIVGLLRDRLTRGVEDAIDDPDELASRIRACYREWKTQRIGETARHYVLAAFTRGLFDARPAGQRLCWLIDDGGAPCPDAEDNALAGALDKGDPFPTGHLYPPAHPGCRCLVVPERQ